PRLVRLQIAIILEDDERLVPVSLRAPADAALRVLRVKEIDVDHELVERRLAIQVGLGLERGIHRRTRILFRFFPRLDAGAYEAPNEVGILLDRVARGENRHAD